MSVTSLPLTAFLSWHSVQPLTRESKGVREGGCGLEGTEQGKGLQATAQLMGTRSYQVHGMGREQLFQLFKVPRALIQGCEGVCVCAGVYTLVCRRSKCRL